MDPFSLTLATITLLQTATSIVQICYDYRIGLENAPKDLARLTKEVISLRDVLQNLVELSEKAESAATSDGAGGIDANALSHLPTLKLLLEPNGPLDHCTTELKALEKKLTAQATGWKATSLGKALRRLKWPMTEEDITNTLNSIERLKTTFNLALTTDLTTIALASQGRLTSLTQSFSLYTLDEYQQKIYQWLSAPDPSSNHNDACKKRQPTTGSWFIKGEQFDIWKAASNSMLWLHGIPGCGKTILSSTIVEDVISHCLSDPELRVAYFYFDFNDKKKQNCENLIRSLVTQLSIQDVSPPKALEALYAINQNGHQQPSRQGLVDTLKSILGLFPKTYIILDALDECTDREELLVLIEEINRWGAVQILATSRKEKDIEEALHPLVTCQICIQDAQIDNDIKLYIRHRLQNDSKLKKWPLKVQREIEESLMAGANGMFRWVVCQLDVLRKCLKLDQLRKALKSLPKTLDETYARILDNIDEEGHSGDAFKILLWLAYSARPLKVEEIAEVIAVDMEDHPRYSPENRLPDPQDIQTICSSLVTIAKSELRLAHFSVKEYLVSNRVRTGYNIAKCAHNYIAQTCVAYLLYFKGPSLLTSDNIDKFPLAGYAAKYWTQHARMARSDIDKPDQLSIELFQSKTDAYVNLVRLFDPDTPWRNKPDMAKSLESISSPLYYASLEGLIELVRQLVKRGANVNAQGGRLGNALQAASSGGYDHIVQLLLEKGANVNAQGGRLGNALQAASAGGYDQIVQLLLEKGAKVNAQGGRSGNALQAASAGGYNQIVQLLLEKGADVNAQGGYYSNALQAASHKGHSQIVQLLLEKEANVNTQGGYYGNALQAASAWGHDQIVQLLLEKGADINAQGGFFGNALQAASAGGYNQIVQLLLEKGTDVNAQGGEYSNALQAALARGHDKIFQLLLEKGADVNAHGGNYSNALQAASAKGHYHIVQVLLENGADVNTQGGFFGNALQAASAGGYDQIVQLLLENGADINMQGGHYGNMLQAASAQGYDQIVQLLLEKGADVNAQGGEYSNALQAALARGHDKIFQLLLEKGADVNAHGGNYSNALQAASAKGHYHIVQLLLENGADVNAQGGFFGNALQAASAGGYDQIVQLLLENGADVNAQGGHHGNALQAASAGGYNQIVQLLLEKGAVQSL